MLQVPPDFAVITNRLIRTLYIHALTEARKSIKIAENTALISFYN